MATDRLTPAANSWRRSSAGYIDPKLTCSGSETEHFSQSASPHLGWCQSQGTQENSQFSSNFWSEDVSSNELYGPQSLFDVRNDFEIGAGDTSRQLNALLYTTGADVSQQSGSSRNDGATSESSTGVFDNGQIKAESDATNMTEMSEMDGESMSNDAYAKILYQCLASTAPCYEMQLQNIYEWFKANTNRGRMSTDEKAWKNSIRHNLSMNNGFQNLSRTNPMGGKKYMWSLTDEVIAAGKIQPTTRFRKQDRKTGRRRAASGSSVAKQRSGSKGGKATRQAARRNPPRAIAGRQDKQQQYAASPTPPASSYTSQSPFDNNLYINNAQYDYNFPSSHTNTPRTPYRLLAPHPAASSYSSPHLYSNLLPLAPSSVPTQGGALAPAPYMTPSTMEMCETPMFAYPRTPFMGQSPAPSFRSLNAGRAIAGATETARNTPNQLQFAAGDYFDVNNSAFLQLQSGHGGFGGALDRSGAEWGADFSPLL